METHSLTTRRFPGDNPFKLGLFSFNNYGGLTNTLAPERWEATWPNMEELSKRAEAAGLEFLLPLAGWLGHDGEAETDGHFHETLAWAAGLLAKTERIHVFATVHVPFVHPVFAAKQAMTCDHIGNGRLGLNLVAGYNIDEFEMFGIPYQEHDQRYAYLEEWLTLVRRMWTEDAPFDFAGEFFQLNRVWSQPKPVGPSRPIVVSAGSSPTGRSFALRHADALFMVIPDLERLAGDLADVRRSMGSRKIDIFASGHVICRRTPRETREYYDYLIHERGDWAAGRYLLRSYEEIKSVPAEVLERPEFLERLMSGYGTLPVVGDPEEVVRTFSRVHKAGIDGMAIALPSYLDDFDLIRDEVLPRMVEAGLRR
ncbi:MAG: LLM class flavin-dependent oxidoreductase [Myxococcales bacterium]|nr:LLM class flavin-dependent oxidoreductase [Myxococcales bacterium]